MTPLMALHQEIGTCTDCPLSRTRNRAVPGEGSERAKVVFIGEAPGWHEDQLGRPFVGPAGQFLDELLTSIGLPRSQVYISNMLKCRPPGNRDPLPAEIRACQKHLDRQLELIGPRVIVALGRYSLAHFFPGETIGKVHGTARKRDNVIYFAMYHPAAALHQQSLRKTIEADIKKLPSLLEEMARVPEEERKPQQLALFRDSGEG